jgi:hypothetical protein
MNESNNIEIWKPIEGYDGWYEVSNIGRVRSFYISPNSNKRLHNPRILKGWKNPDGYPSVRLSGRKMFSIHRLVALAFIPNPDNKPQINHINGIKSDNIYTNLEWIDNRENQIHSYIKLNRAHVGAKKKPILQFDLNNKLINEYPSIASARRAMGADSRGCSLYKALVGKRKTYKGFKWKYKNEQ